jgi:hypothetical protein
VHPLAEAMLSAFVTAWTGHDIGQAWSLGLVNVGTRTEALDPVHEVVTVLFGELDRVLCRHGQDRHRRMAMARRRQSAYHERRADESATALPAGSPIRPAAGRRRPSGWGWELARRRFGPWRWGRERGG